MLPMETESMNIRPIFDKKNVPVIIAGPCSAETEEQVLTTAHALKHQGIDLFRAGIWKPRTRPGSFEGVGAVGLPWLKKVKEETGLKVTTEVAKIDHVEQALNAGVDVLWIGARTTVNPFSIQEIADALQGIQIPILIKNPINPDLKLWMGAIERIYGAGIEQIAVIHRGFSYHGHSGYRNIPRWEIPIELKRHFPSIEIICDNSHICGRRDILQEVAQKAMDLNFDGIMTEVHPTPDEAWSDAAQQITPNTFHTLLQNLVLRSTHTTDSRSQEQLAIFRSQIESLDHELLRILGERMKIADQIGQLKKENQITILQVNRWNKMLQEYLKKGVELGLSTGFTNTLLQAIHQESINHQAEVMNQSIREEMND